MKQTEGDNSYYSKLIEYPSLLLSKKTLGFGQRLGLDSTYAWDDKKRQKYPQKKMQ